MDTVPAPTATEIPSTATDIATEVTSTPSPEPTVAVTATLPVTGTVTALGDPSRGPELFALYTCDSCHAVTLPFPGGEYAPNLGNISTEAERIIASPEYTGTATNAAEYIRESILTPNVYIVPGENYIRPNGLSVMKQDFARIIPSQDLHDLVAYLLTLDAQ
jgi:nitric oxide reductase subunit C